MMVMIATASTSPLRVLRSADSHLRCRPVGSTHSMDRRPTHLASESSSGAVLMTLALCDDILESVAANVFVACKVEAEVKARALCWTEELAGNSCRRVKRSKEICDDGTRANVTAQHTSMCC